jgi:parvulin-like peptidyl-prolyl isomerase
MLTSLATAATVGAVLAGTPTAWGQASRLAPTATRPAQGAAQPGARPAQPTAQPAPRTASTAPSSVPANPQSKIVAVVNGEQMSRQELATECLRRYGTEVLETIVNRQVIMQACKTANVEITDKDVTAEITRLAKKFGLSPDAFLMMLERERGISPEQYHNEIVWPTLALKALASNQMQVTPQEMQRAFETNYGPKVKARIIAIRSAEKAAEVHAKVKAQPELFGEMAKDHSEDVNSASAHGLIPPISRHVGDPEIERVAFGLKEGEVSPILKIADQHIIIKCDKHLPETYIAGPNLKDAEDRLRDQLHDEKLRAASTKLFEELQQQSNVINVYNDAKLRAQYPGVAASINGQPITIAYLAEECIARHGVDVLEGEINRKILTQEMKRRNMEVTQQDLDDEIARAAISYNFVKPDGTADLAAWQKSLEENDGASLDLYVRDAVWPSVALKKLVSQSIQVTEDDLQKGFEANYGERVEAQAIVLTNNRQAQQVWEMARGNATEEFFGQLAAEYSIDPVSKGNNGRVPPIRMHSGQPKIEKEAFSLQPGSLSAILAIDDKFVILRCLGRTRPITTEYEAVKQELAEDIYEKKLRLAMAQEFDRVRERAQLDNLLTGETRQGATAKAVLGPAPQTDPNVRPAAATRAGSVLPMR